jgi:hypothetical protein
LAHRLDPDPGARVTEIFSAGTTNTIGETDSSQHAMPGAFHSVIPANAGIQISPLPLRQILIVISAEAGIHLDLDLDFDVARPNASGNLAHLPQCTKNGGRKPLRGFRPTN